MKKTTTNIKKLQRRRQKTEYKIYNEKTKQFKAKIKRNKTKFCAFNFLLFLFSSFTLLSFYFFYLLCSDVENFPSFSTAIFLLLHLSCEIDSIVVKAFFNLGNLVDGILCKEMIFFCINFLTDDMKIHQDQKLLCHTVEHPKFIGF